MTIGRRGVLGLGALGASAVALDACGVFPWAKTAAGPAPEDVERLLRELDVTVAQLGALEPDVTRFGIKPENASVEGTAAVKELLTTVCFLGSYRDVPAPMWSEPKIEARLADTLPKINATIDKARAYVSALSNERSARIEKMLQEDPNLTTRILERVDDYAKQVHVPFEQRAYLRGATSQLAGRFRYEGLKEVTTKISSKFARTLASRKSELGMAGDDMGGGGGGSDAGIDAEADGGAEEQKTQPTPLRARFHTRATVAELRSITCGLQPKVTVGGVERPIVLDWEEFRCPTTSTDANAIRGTVHLEKVEGGDNVVTVALYVPPDVEVDLTETVTGLGRELKKRLDARARSNAGASCVTSADCGGLHCVQNRCLDPRAPRTSTVSGADAHLGTSGESCRGDADCESPLKCTHGACSANEASSAKLIATTGKVAKWGAILLIPPICAIGVLVLLACLFMVIVAGFEYAGGD